MKKTEQNKIIGYWGYPVPDVLSEIKKFYPNHEFVDLDVNQKALSSGILPENSCRIIRNIVDNAFELKDRMELIVASVGEEKCNSALFTAKILEEEGFKVVRTKYEKISSNIKQTPICKSSLPLKEKIDLVMNSIIQPEQNTILQESKPSFGFWGVPPNDFGFLDIFPKNTHMYGWIRCVEACEPANLDLEMFVDKNVPTVFFAQTFCSKMQTAKYLAKKYDGLYIDVDDIPSKSVIAKVEAFIKLG